MRQGHKLWAAFGAAALVVGGGTLAASPASAAGAALSVTPHTNLHAGDTVQAGGTGFFPGEQVIVLECASSPPTPDSCDLTNAVFTSAGARGRFVTPLQVHRRLLTSTSIVDCLAAHCSVVALGEVSFTNAVRITFSATGEPSPKVGAKPSYRLRDLQRVEIVGRGFASTSSPAVAECLGAGPLAQSCVSITTAANDGKGGFHTSIVVRRTITNPRGTRVDSAKAVGTCVLVALDGNDLDYLATAPLGFDRSIPPPPPATVTLSPSTKLPYYAHVRVRGAHWTPGDLLEITECAGQSCGALFTEARVAADGGFDTTLLVSRVVPDYGPAASAPGVAGTDCVKSHNCSITVVDEDEAGLVVAPLTFDPKAPIPPDASISVTPGGPYRNNQVVQIKGAHFPPLVGYGVAECVVSAESVGCLGEGGQGSPTTDAHGAFATTFQLVSRSSEFGFDCLDPSTACMLVAQSEGGVEAVKSLHFVAGANSAGPSVALHRVASPAVPATTSGCGARPSATRGWLRLTAAGRRALGACGDLHRFAAASRAHSAQ